MSSSGMQGHQDAGSKGWVSPAIESENQRHTTEGVAFLLSGLSDQAALYQGEGTSHGRTELWGEAADASKGRTQTPDLGALPFLCLEYTGQPQAAELVSYVE